MTRVFIFDYSGTLDVIDNPRGYLVGLREKNPGCRIYINSGMPYGHIVDELGLKDGDVDEIFSKKIVKTILKEITNHPDSIFRVDNPVKSSEMEVFVIDDQDFNTWAYDDISEDWGISIHLFQKVTQLEESLNK